MPTWLSVVLVILVVLGVGMVVERRRMARVQRWSEPRGFRQLSPMPSDIGARLQSFLARIEPTAFLGWGLILQGEHGGGVLVLAEYRVSGGHKRPEKWRTLAALSVPWVDYPLMCWRRHRVASAGQRAAAEEDGWMVWEGTGPGYSVEPAGGHLSALDVWDLPDALGTSGPYVLVVRETMLKEPELDALLHAVSQARTIIDAMPARQAL